MKRITIQNYRTDQYYRRIVEVVGDILEQSDFVAPVDVFVRMDLLSEEALDDWRAGRVPYLREGCEVQPREGQLHPQDSQDACP